LVEGDLRDAAQAQARSSWSQARAALDRAQVRLGTGGSEELRHRVMQCGRELELVARLDDIRLNRVTRGELVFYKAQADGEYVQVFGREGIRPGDEPQSVAAAINGSPVRGAIVAALDDWLVCSTNLAQRAWLIEVARETNQSPQGWRQRVLDPTAWEDPRNLAELAKTAPVEEESVSLLLALGERLRMARRDAIPLLKRVQAEHPDDFWANLILGNAVLQALPVEASGYYRAALASRPEAAVGYCAVGDAFRIQKMFEEAIEYYQKALRLDPGYARAHSDLGLALQAQVKWSEAIDCYRRALAIDPDYAWAHHNFGNVLRMMGRLDEADEQYQEVLRLDPNNREVQEGIRSNLLRRGRGREAQLAWRKALEANPPEHDAWFGYAELCLFLQDEEEYHRACRDLLDRFGTTSDPFIAERVSRACLLKPAGETELRIGLSLADLAGDSRESASMYVYKYFLFAKGLAEYRRDRFDEAISVMSGNASTALRPAPLIVVAMSQFRQGETEQARKTLASAILSFDWTAPHADTRDFQIRHILRREAEALILPNLPAFLRGEYQPLDNDERLSLLGVCQFEDRRGAEASLLAAAFAADPTLADNLDAGLRYRAACSAAVAGRGRGADGAGLSDDERARWREQAREWLRADLAVWKQRLDDDPGDRDEKKLIRDTLSRWQTDPDLRLFREPNAQADLPPAERSEWRSLWQDVDALLKRAQDVE